LRKGHKKEEVSIFEKFDTFVALCGTTQKYKTDLNIINTVS